MSQAALRYHTLEIAVGATLQRLSGIEGGKRQGGGQEEGGGRWRTASSSSEKAAGGGEGRVDAHPFYPVTHCRTDVYVYRIKI